MLTKVSDSLLIDVSEIKSAHLEPCTGGCYSPATADTKCVVITKAGDRLEVGTNADMTFRQISSILAGR